MLKRGLRNIMAAIYWPHFQLSLLLEKGFQILQSRYTKPSSNIQNIMAAFYWIPSYFLFLLEWGFKILWLRNIEYDLIFIAIGEGVKKIIAAKYWNILNFISNWERVKYHGRDILNPSSYFQLWFQRWFHIFWLRYIETPSPPLFIAKGEGVCDILAAIFWTLLQLSLLLVRGFQILLLL